MSQEYTNSRKQRRANRANRNRPVLVTSSEVNASAQADDNTPVEQPSTAVATEIPTPTTSQPVTPPATATTGQRSRRLPGFFSTVGKKEENAQEEKTQVAQARIARATRAKGVTNATGKNEAVTTEKSAKAEKSATTPQPATKAPAKPTNTALNRPGSTFKMRYIIGMVIYLLVAEIAGGVITSTFTLYKMNSVLLQFPLFGGHAVITSATVVYLIVLIALLALLARFDFLPRSLGAMANTPPNRGNATSNNSSRGESRKLPAVRQGVQGANDDLYQQYRANQRKKK